MVSSSSASSTFVSDAVAAVPSVETAVGKDLPRFFCLFFLFFSVNTWEHLPYRAVLESATRTAKAGSSIHTFLRGLKLQTSAVLWSRCQTADLSSSMAALQCCDPGMPQTADLGSFMAALGR